MYTAITQFGIDKALNTLIEECGIAEAYIREYWRRRGLKLWRVDKFLGDLQESKKCDLIDNFGTRWEIKTDKLAFVTGNVYVEQQAFLALEADKYLIFAGKAFVVEKQALAEEFARTTTLTPGGDNHRSMGLLLPLERLEEISEEVIVL
jgi:hypothetical protein